MTTYRIMAPHFVAAVIVSSDVVMQSAPILRWAVGRDWPKVRDYCNAKGWTIEPLPDENDAQVTWIDTEEASYELKWIGRKCIRITKHVEGEQPEDVVPGDLPDEVERMITR